MSSYKKIFIFVLFIATLVRVVSLLCFMNKYDISIHENVLEAYRFPDDSFIYYDTACNVMDGNGYSISVNLLSNNDKLPSYLAGLHNGTYYQNFYPPVYSIFLAVLYSTFGLSILSYAIPQIILGVLSCYLVYLIALRITNSEMIGIVACFFLSMYPSIVWWTSYIRNETLFMFLFLSFNYMFIITLKARRIKHFIGSGLLFGLSFLCRNVIIYLPLFIIIFLLFYKYKYYYIIVFISACFLLPCLWGMRNKVIFGKFNISTAEDWGVFYTGNIVGQKFKFFDLYEIDASLESHPMVDDESYNKKASIEFVRQHPLTYSKLCLKRLIAYWSPFTKKVALHKKAIDGLIYIVIFPMAIYGMIIRIMKKNMYVYFVFLVVFYFTIIHSLVIVDDALIYRYPIIPLICIFSAIGYKESY